MGFRKFKVVVAAGIAFAIPTGSLVYLIARNNINETQINKIKEKYGDTYDYYLKTDEGRPLKLKIKNNVLPVILNYGFDDETIKIAEHALSKLDNILDYTTVKLYENGNMPDNYKYIAINIEDLGYGTSSTSAGEAHLTYNKKTGYIDYPVTVSIDKKFTDCYWTLEEGEKVEESVFSSILQHEIGHCFGLKDLYKGNSSTYSQSVMSGTLGLGTKDYSELDAHNLKHIYDIDDKEYDVTVSYPESMVFINQEDKNKQVIEEDEMTL